MVVGVTLFLFLIFSGVIRNVFEAVTFKPRPGKPGQSFKDVSQACSWLRKAKEMRDTRLTSGTPRAVPVSLVNKQQM